MIARAKHAVILLGLGLALLVSFSGPSTAQVPMTTVEGYDLQSLTVSAPITQVLPLAPPYWAVAAGPYLLIADDTNPAQFQIVAQVSLPNSILDMTVVGTRLFLATGDTGLVILDVNNPLAPLFLGAWSRVKVISVAVSSAGEYAYVCKGDTNIFVLNVKEPSHPKQIKMKSYKKANFYNLIVAANALITAAGPKGVIVYSIEQPNEPAKMKRVKELRATRHIALNGKLLAATDDDLGTVFVSFPTWAAPAMRGSVPAVSQALDCAFLSCDPTKVIVAEGMDGYRIVDATDPDIPTTLARSATPSPVVSVSAICPHLYLSCRETGLYSLDVSNPAQPQTQLVLPGQAVRGPLVVLDNSVIVSSNSSMETWDFTDPAQPQKLSATAIPTKPTDFTLAGDLLAVSDQEDGLLLYDVSAPAAPQLLYTIPIPFPGNIPAQTALSGNMMAVAAGSMGALLYDVSTPSVPIQQGFWLGKKKSFVTGVAFGTTGTLWVMDMQQGLTALNVANPAAPVELGHVSLELNIGRLYTYQNYVYCAASYLGVAIVDGSDPSKPNLKTAIQGPKDTSTIFLSGSEMLVSDGSAGLRLYDLTNPLIPCQTAYFEAPGYTYSAGLLTDGSTVASCREGGVWGLTSASCQSADLALPCDEQTLLPFHASLFSWQAVSGVEYKVQVSIDPGFPSNTEKTLVGTAGSNKALKVPSWVPNTNEWRWIRKKAHKWGTLYWRVEFIVGKNKSYSESRTFFIK